VGKARSFPHQRTLNVVQTMLQEGDQPPCLLRWEHKGCDENTLAEASNLETLDIPC